MKKQKNPRNESMSEDELREKFLDDFSINGMDVNVRLVSYNKILFVSVKDKPKKKQKKNILPTYFAIIPNENYFFCCKKVVFSCSLMSIANGLGYEDYKKIKLDGKDIPSLVQLLLNRKIAIAEKRVMKSPLKFKEPPMTLT